MVHSRQDFHQTDDDDLHKRSEMIVDYHDSTNTQKIHLVLVARPYLIVVPISNTMELLGNKNQMIEYHCNEQCH